MASLRKRGKHWYCRYRDIDGRQKEVKCGPDKSVANQMAIKLESKRCQARAGTLDPRESDAIDAERHPITKHVADYIKNLEARGCVPEHVGNVRRRLEWFLGQTKIGRLSQIRPSLAVAALKTLRAGGRGDQTVNHYATTWKALTKWAWKDRRSRADLLADFELPRVVTAKQRIDIPLELVIRLISTTRQEPQRRGINGLDRSMLYLVAAVTGLRRSELMSLTVQSFDLDGSPATVSLPGSETKNSDGAVQPLPSSIVDELRTWLAGKSVDRPLWNIPQNSAAMIRADLRAAGTDDADRFDFHGLRHSFVSAVIRAGGSIKDSMELARHHDADLTFGRYAHSRLADLAAVVDRIPDLLCPRRAQVNVSTGRNGTLEMSPGKTQVDP